MFSIGGSESPQRQCGRGTWRSGLRPPHWRCWSPACRTVMRTRRVHSGSGPPDDLFGRGVVRAGHPGGCAVTVVLVRSTPHDVCGCCPVCGRSSTAWGFLRPAGFMPRQIFVVGVWFLATGALCLTTGMAGRALSPWEMGFPIWGGAAADRRHPQICLSGGGRRCVKVSRRGRASPTMPWTVSSTSGPA